jgi:hypothetical protein
VTGQQLRLSQPRDVSTLFRDSLATFFRHAGVFVLLSAAVVVPVHLVVEGIGMEMLTGPYDDSPSVAEAAVPTVVGFLVVSPIITAICIHALRSIAAGEKIGASQAFVSGFEAFTPLFFAVLLAAIGIAVGFVLLILPGIFLAVKLFFVPQAVVIGNTRGMEALRLSWEVTRGFWWRTLGLVILVNIAAALPAILITTPFAGIASSSNDAIWSLVGTILAESVTAPFVAIFATLLWYDLRARSVLA